MYTAWKHVHILLLYANHKNYLMSTQTDRNYMNLSETIKD